MTLRNGVLVAALAGLLALPVVRADTGNLPNLGEDSRQGLTPTQERLIGEAAMLEIRRSGDMLDDAELTDYINQIGRRLVEANGSNIPFTFFIVRDGSINAFALPGGFVGVFTGLIATTQHESELAAVMAHEISHVTQHHLARMIDSQRMTPWITLAALGLAILAAHGGAGDIGVAAAAGTSGYLIQRQLDFTYAYEQEADRIGMQTLLASGFDPYAMPTFFGRMQKANRLLEFSAPEFLRTHPVTYRRIAEAEDRLADVRYKQVLDSADYLYLRERAIVLQSDDLKATVQRYRSTLAEKRYLNLGAHLYGLAFAQARVGDYDNAWQTLLRVREVYGKPESHPVLEYLAGSIRLEQQKYDDALTLFRDAERHFPASRALIYGEVDALTRARRYDEALAAIQTAGVMDAALYQRQAKIYEATGQAQRQHMAQGEYYAFQHEYTAAIEQFQIAQRQPGADFYQLSGIDARLKELQVLVADRKELRAQ
ncbi:M48 family metalloprotease [Silvimonas sp.]|uniref:M48 family metalloprotease n=1 Tax=Silvimonas sp. TaxID=2650811 RepID=UPI00283DDF3F|nr:M48 family metalloprotease [Silvimonas sp.]MDR3428039.1 M48 family metalloprotease [Silvimonas sp.]